MMATRSQASYHGFTPPLLWSFAVERGFEFKPALKLELDE